MSGKSILSATGKRLLDSSGRKILLPDAPSSMSIVLAGLTTCCVRTNTAPGSVSLVDPNGTYVVPFLDYHQACAHYSQLFFMPATFYSDNTCSSVSFTGSAQITISIMWDLTCNFVTSIQADGSFFQQINVFAFTRTDPPSCDDNPDVPNDYTSCPSPNFGLVGAYGGTAAVS